MRSTRCTPAGAPGLLPLRPPSRPRSPPARGRRRRGHTGRRPGTLLLSHTGLRLVGTARLVVAGALPASALRHSGTPLPSPTRLAGAPRGTALVRRLPCVGSSSNDPPHAPGLPLAARCWRRAGRVVLGGMTATLGRRNASPLGRFGRLVRRVLKRRKSPIRRRRRRGLRWGRVVARAGTRVGFLLCHRPTSRRGSRVLYPRRGLVHPVLRRRRGLDLLRATSASTVGSSATSARSALSRSVV